MKRACTWVNAAAFGRQEETHSGEFWGLSPPVKVEIRYMDFKVVDGKIVDNWVNVDFAYVAAQLGVDLFNGEGWKLSIVVKKNHFMPELNDRRPEPGHDHCWRWKCRCNCYGILAQRDP